MPPTATGAAATKRTTSGGSDRPALTQRRAEDEELRPYVIVGDLGKGSFATVYRGYHEVRHTNLSALYSPHELRQHTNVSVAIKTVNRSGLSPKLLENLRGEISILKALSHRHITRLLDIVVRLSLVSELL